MDLIHNKVIKIVSGPLYGLYRILLSEVLQNELIVACINPPAEDDQAKDGKEVISITQYRTNQIVWLNHAEVVALDSQKLILQVDTELDAMQLNPSSIKSNYERYERRVLAMTGFLNFENFRTRLLTDGNCGQLVKEAMAAGKFSKPYIHQLLVLLCRFGFSQNALRLQFHKCGAVGVARPCGPNRNKAGAKSIKERIAKISGETLATTQPGMTEEWRQAILAADISIPTPKPTMPRRFKAILDSAFMKDYTFVNGQLRPTDLKLGSYPNVRQIKRVLEVNSSAIEYFRNKTTPKHFTANHRGLVGASWEGVAGPGHTYAMDSTVGDVYLRSALNPEWIVGRPIVYVIVDVWSTAIVGFYVCLTGPSWDMAKIAMFCAFADPTLIAELRGVNLQNTLFPHPTIPSTFLFDRGEYLSTGASLTGASLDIISMSYTPPYRGDLKGVAEVPHRIQKDEQFMFVPGAIDARRKEYELRKFDSKTAVLTTREYTQYLYSVFNEYNVCGDRTHRLDAHMKATDVHPSPAGLWEWGHSVGIGTQLHRDPSELITSLLPQGESSVTRNGLKFDGIYYTNRTEAEADEATVARNAGSWKKPIYFYPGSVSKIWTPDIAGRGMVALEISDHSTASPEITKDEHDDGNAYNLLNKVERNHESLLTSLGQREGRRILIDEAVKKRTQVPPSFNLQKPSITEARILEKNADLRVSEKPPIVAAKKSLNDKVIQAHTSKLHDILNPQKKVSNDE